MKLSVTKRIILSLLILLTVGVVSVVLFLPPTYAPVTFPDGKDFAFTIFDDTDASTIENVKPVYDYLYDLGIITTKSVWVLPTNEPDVFVSNGQTLSDPDYVSFVLDLQKKGFEIASHGSRGGSTKHPEIQIAIERFKEIVGHYPHTHANHFRNRDNLYHGANRLEIWPLKDLYHLITRRDKDYFVGHIRESEYFWGDIAQKHVTYVRNFTYKDINTLKVNPSMPYHDPKKPYVNFWFSSSDGRNVKFFNQLLSKENLDRLEREGGVCIVYTHFANGFVSDTLLNRTTVERLQDLASRNGYFAPVNETLDYLKLHHSRGRNLSWRERLTMEIRWILEKIIHGTY